MLVIRVRECSTRHHVLREVFGYHASTVRKLLMDAGHTRTHKEKKIMESNVTNSAPHDRYRSREYEEES